jgi:hypothetical protein
MPGDSMALIAPRGGSVAPTGPIRSKGSVAIEGTTLPVDRTRYSSPLCALQHRSWPAGSRSAGSALRSGMVPMTIKK